MRAKTIDLYFLIAYNEYIDGYETFMFLIGGACADKLLTKPSINIWD